MQDADAFLVRKGLEFSDYFDDLRPAVLDDEHMASVNYERYFFADVASKGRFDGQPLRFAGKVTDPVSKERFVPGAGSPTTRHGGQLWVFASHSTRERFVRDPERFERPRWRM